MHSYTYFLHFVRRYQENNSDLMALVCGEKGTGKSTLSISLARDYIKKYGYKCPHCGNEFFKNLYHMERQENSYKFYIPDFIKNDRAYIVCPRYYELDMKTKEKNLVSGCGEKSLFSQLKRIKWDADKFISYDVNDAYRKLLKLPQYSPIIFDEAINFMSTMDFNKTESKEMKKLLTVLRPRRLFMLFCIPKINWIDSKYRDVMSHFWLQCVERGTASVFEKDKGITADPYHIKEAEKLMGNVKFFTDMKKVKRNLRKHPCYFDMFNYTEMDSKTYDDYEAVRNARNLARQTEEMELSNKDMAKMMCWNLLNNWDSIIIDVNKSRNTKITHQIVNNRILFDPLTRKRLVSETTMRNWIRGIEEYIKTKGKDASGFDMIKL